MIPLIVINSMRYYLFSLFLIIFFYFFFESFIEVNAFINFEDVSKNAGIYYIGDSYGSSWGDFNNDKWVDLFVSNHGKYGNGTSLFLNNMDGSFIDVAPNLGLSNIWNMDLHTASWVDYDNDNDKDLLILVGAGAGTGIGPSTNNIFLVNNNGTFSNEATDLGLDYSLGRGRMPIWFDVNKDGFLDVFLINALRPDGEAPPALFMQTGDGFNKTIDSTEFNFENIWAGQLSDLSLDGNLDLAFFIEQTEAIYDLTSIPFKEIKNKTKLPEFKNVWGTVFGDFNGDLRNDIFLSRGGFGNHQPKDDILLFRNETTFSDMTIFSGFENPSICRDSIAADFDNDMDLDIYQICSMWKYYQSNDTSLHKNLPNQLYENKGDGTFQKVPDAGGAEGSDKGVGDSVSVADYDNDGFLDLYITNSLFPKFGPSQLFRNLGNQNNWLEIDLIGTLTNRDAIGSRVILFTPDKIQLREQNGGMHYRSQDSSRIHFGLGNNTMVNSIIVYWPSGIVSGLQNIESNKILEIVEPIKQTSPKQQLLLGINPLEIICNNGFKLIEKPSSEKIACVKPSTVIKLVERGWLDLS